MRISCSHWGMFINPEEDYWIDEWITLDEIWNKIKCPREFARTA